MVARFTREPTPARGEQAKQVAMKVRNKDCSNQRRMPRRVGRHGCNHLKRWRTQRSTTERSGSHLTLQTTRCFAHFLSQPITRRRSQLNVFSWSRYVTHFHFIFGRKSVSYLSNSVRKKSQACSTLPASTTYTIVKKCSDQGNFWQNIKNCRGQKLRPR